MLSLFCSQIWKPVEIWVWVAKKNVSEFQIHSQHFISTGSLSSVCAVLACQSNTQLGDKSWRAHNTYVHKAPQLKWETGHIQCHTDMSLVFVWLASDSFAVQNTKVGRAVQAHHKQLPLRQSHTAGYTFSLLPQECYLVGGRPRMKLINSNPHIYLSYPSSCQLDEKASERQI